MANVTFFYGKNDFEAEISLTDQELSELKWILLNAKSLMKVYNEDYKSNLYKTDCLNIDKLLRAIQTHKNKFED